MGLGISLVETRVLKWKMVFYALMTGLFVINYPSFVHIVFKTCFCLVTFVYKIQTKLEMRISTISIVTVVLFLLISCHRGEQINQETLGANSRVIVHMITAVNKKDALDYVKDFDDSVQVFVESVLKVNGKQELIENRKHHFAKHPEVRSEIQHLVEIDNKVILHDKVWLSKEDQQGKDIVEIFTFRNNKVIKVEVIQPKNLFETNPY